MTKAHRHLLAGVVACALLTAAAPAANASQVSLSGTTVTLTAAPGEVNRVDVSMNEEIVDLAGITPGPGCVALSSTRVECGVDHENDTTVDWDTFVVSLGDGDDTYESAHLTLGRVVIDAGPGNDRLLGIDANEGAEVDAGPGDDRVEGSDGDDRLLGGPGADTLEGGRGNDDIDGQAGTDILVGDSTGDALAQGNDRIVSRDGERDQVSCQFGSDTVTADALDVVEELACESIDRPAAAPKKSPRAKAIAKCRTIKGRGKAAKARKARCLRKARRIAP